MLFNKNKINFLIQKLIIFNYNSYVIYKNTKYQKNEFFLYFNFLYTTSFNLSITSYLIDMVCVDSLYLKLLNINLNVLLIQKFYAYNINIFYNIIMYSNVLFYSSINSN